MFERMKLLAILISTYFLFTPLYAQSDTGYVFVSEQSDFSFNNAGEKHVNGSLSLLEKSTDQVIEYQYDYYAPAPASDPAHETGNKLVIITPTIEGATPLEFLLKDYLQNRGFHVLIPRSLPLVFNYDETTFEQFETFSVRSHIGTSSILNILAGRESFDAKSIGLLGASLGGIRSSILFGLDSRFKAMFVAVAGADFPSLYAYSDNSVLRPIRKEHMKYLGVTLQSEYEELLRDHLVIDPKMITHSPYLANVAMVISDDDDVVPTYNQWQLWSTIKAQGVHPKTFITQSGHVQGALHLLRYRSIIAEWFKERL